MAVDASFSLLTGNDIETRRVRAGDVIFREGDKADELFVIKSGSVRIQVGNRAMADLAADNIFGEMALVDQAPRMAMAKAVESTTVVIITESMLEQKLRRTDPFIRGLFTIFVRTIRDLTTKVLEFVKSLAAGLHSAGP